MKVFISLKKRSVVEIISIYIIINVLSLLVLNICNALWDNLTKENDEVMKILICDDDKEMLNEVTMFCKRVCNKEDIIIAYDNPKIFYDDLLKEYPKVELFILDIEMPDLDGLELKRQISYLYQHTNIFFLTSHREMMEEAFGRNVMGFLQKDNYQSRLGQYIKELRDMEEKEDIVEFVIGNERKIFHKSRIVTVQAQHIYSIVTYVHFYNRDKKRMETRTESFRLSLGKWEQSLGGMDFYKVSRSLIINFRYVKRITNRIFLENGEELEIPVKKVKALKQAYNAYCMQVARITY